MDKAPIQEKKGSREVVILGGRYTIKSSYQSAFVDRTAALVNHEMNEIIRDGGVIPTDKVAILACMNLASELLKIREEYQGVRDRITKRLEKILAMLDTCLAQEEMSYVVDKPQRREIQENENEKALPCR